MHNAEKPNPPASVRDTGGQGELLASSNTRARNSLRAVATHNAPSPGVHGENAACRVRSGCTLSIRLNHLPPLTPCTRAVNIRSVQTFGSTCTIKRRISLARIVFADTAAGCSSVDLVIASPLSCTPWLDRCYPASSLLWVL